MIKALIAGIGGAAIVFGLQLGGIPFTPSLIILGGLLLLVGSFAVHDHQWRHDHGGPLRGALQNPWDRLR